MRRISTALVTVCLTMATVTAPAVAQDAPNNKVVATMEEMSAQGSSAQAGSAGEASSKDPLTTTLIVFGSALGFVVLGHIILSAINADQYHTIFSGSSRATNGGPRN